MSGTDLPYLTEYAKTGRSSCKGCKTSIAQGSLRLAVMVQSAHFDGKQPLWFHFECFFKKQRPRTTDDIEHFEALRIEDQDKIKAKVGLSQLTIVPDKKGKKRGSDALDSKLKKEAMKDFRIEYAKSGRALCRGCEQKIIKDEVRIAKKDFETDVGKKYGGQDLWHHVTCFAQVRGDLGYFESGDKLTGFKGLKKDDQEIVKKSIVAIKQEDVPLVKKIKTEDEVDGNKDDKYREQNKIMYKYRDFLDELYAAKSNGKAILTKLLEYNNQKPFIGKEKILDQLADAMTFGALEPCDTCKGQFEYTSSGYVCSGDLTEWTKCKKVVKEPKRTPFKIPTELKDEFPFLNKYKFKSRTRIIKSKSPVKNIKKENQEEMAEPRVKRDAPPLYDMKFVILGKPPKGKDEIKKLITNLGGKLVTKIDNTVMAVISTPEEVEKKNYRMEEAEIEKIHVVPDSFLDEVKNNQNISDLIIKNSICSWGSDPTVRLPSSTSKSTSKSSQSIYTKSVPKSVKLKLKGGTAVDPDSGLENKAHVYQKGDETYCAVLGLTDIQTGRNSYYKLQVLESDKKNKYWVFRSWGRIGTTIGSTKLSLADTLFEALREFKDVYKEKTGNEWEKRNNFQKVPGKMYPIETDYGPKEEEVKKLESVDSKSNLPLQVQDLIRMIFDVDSMNKLMLEFELDTEKMPLGKLSKKQIQKAYTVLNELQMLINDKAEHSRLIDASNRFYTFIPHSFGIADPPVLDDPEDIKKKILMLDSLMELEIAYNLMKASGSESTVDNYYKQLNTELQVLDRDTEEFNIISEYVKNTHAATHNNYELIIDDVFVVKREGEDKRYKPFSKLPNRKLLWHGSRVTNFAGILSQGLRIAPPEAPSTGYMFGKGIYFADMVSKSANYCCTSASNPKGLMLLCDVALGNMYERLNADYITKLPKGMHSCKGVGRTEPDPSTVKKIADVEVPLGKAVPSAKTSSLLYNEYIVYDVAQVKVKYLLKMHFDYKYSM